MPARFTKPYVDALFDVAGSSETVEATLGPLENLARTLGRSEELRKVLRNPGIERARREAILTAVSAKVGVTELGKRLLIVLLHNRRIGALSEVLAAGRDRLDRERRIVEATLKSARQLEPAVTEKLQRMLEERTKKKVRLATAVDPSLLGGFVITVESAVFDASLSRRLEKARAALHSVPPV
jgi:ATP synthase F1 delta subunit